jgi:hypothetical protein
MLQDQGLGFDLSTAPLLARGRTRSISAENPLGEPGAGGRAAGPLGAGRKGRPCIALATGSVTVLADIAGPGVIQSVWCTVPDATDAGPFVLRDLVLRIYWDGEESPSVEVPLGDFFCNGFGARCRVSSQAIVVNPTGGMNCYFPMPFARRAKVTLENQHPADIGTFFYQINYTLVDALPPSAAYFHAAWRREEFAAPGKDFSVLAGVRGRGHYVGTYLAWTALDRYWWGEGEFKFFIDGDDAYPTVCGTGVEDYFGGAWCFYEFGADGALAEQTYSTPYLGYPYFSETTKRSNASWLKDIRHLDKVFDTIPKHGLYRWHLLDPIRFESDLAVTVQRMGYDTRQLFERADDVAAVAYWYQTEPHAAFPAFSPAADRRPR